MMERMMASIASMSVPEGTKTMLKDFESQITSLKIPERSASQLSAFGNQGSIHLRVGMEGFKREWVEDAVFKHIDSTSKKVAIVQAERITEHALMDYGSAKTITPDVEEDFRLMVRAIVLKDCIGQTEKDFVVELAKSYNIKDMEKLLVNNEQSRSAQTTEWVNKAYETAPPLVRQAIDIMKEDLQEPKVKIFTAHSEFFEQNPPRTRHVGSSVLAEGKMREYLSSKDVQELAGRVGALEFLKAAEAKEFLEILVRGQAPAQLDQYHHWYAEHIDGDKIRIELPAYGVHLPSNPPGERLIIKTLMALGYTDDEIRGFYAKYQEYVPLVPYEPRESSAD